MTKMLENSPKLAPFILLAVAALVLGGCGGGCA
jgi:hypothetical protein